jgi:hypothetical protein
MKKFLFLLLIVSCGTDNSVDLNAKVFRDTGTVRIVNSDSFDYSSTKITINGEYEAKIGLISAGESKDIPVTDFSNSSGVRMDFDQVVKEVEIECELDDNKVGFYLGDFN